MTSPGLRIPSFEGFCVIDLETYHEKNEDKLVELTVRKDEIGMQDEPTWRLVYRLEPHYRSARYEGSVYAELEVIAGQRTKEAPLPIRQTTTKPSIEMDDSVVLLSVESHTDAMGTYSFSRVEEDPSGNAVYIPVCEYTLYAKTIIHKSICVPEGGSFGIAPAHSTNYSNRRWFIRRPLKKESIEDCLMALKDAGESAKLKGFSNLASLKVRSSAYVLGTINEMESSRKVKDDDNDDEEDLASKGMSAFEEWDLLRGRILVMGGTSLDTLSACAEVASRTYGTRWLEYLHPTLDDWDTYTKTKKSTQIKRKDFAKQVRKKGSLVVNNADPIKHTGIYFCTGDNVLLHSSGGSLRGGVTSDWNRNGSDKWGVLAIQSVTVVPLAAFRSLTLKASNANKPTIQNIANTLALYDLDLDTARKDNIFFRGGYAANPHDLCVYLNQLSDFELREVATKFPVVSRLPDALPWRNGIYLHTKRYDIERRHWDSAGNLLMDGIEWDPILDPHELKETRGVQPLRKMDRKVAALLALAALYLCSAMYARRVLLTPNEDDLNHDKVYEDAKQTLEALCMRPVNWLIRSGTGEEEEEDQSTSSLYSSSSSSRLTKELNYVNSIENDDYTNVELARFAINYLDAYKDKDAGFPARLWLLPPVKLNPNTTYEGPVKGVRDASWSSKLKEVLRLTNNETEDGGGDSDKSSTTYVGATYNVLMASFATLLLKTEWRGAWYIMKDVALMYPYHETGGNTESGYNTHYRAQALDGLLKNYGTSVKIIKDVLETWDEDWFEEAEAYRIKVYEATVSGSMRNRDSMRLNDLALLFDSSVEKEVEEEGISGKRNGVGIREIIQSTNLTTSTVLQSRASSFDPQRNAFFVKQGERFEYSFAHLIPLRGTSTTQDCSVNIFARRTSIYGRNSPVIDEDQQIQLYPISESKEIDHCFFLNADGVHALRFVCKRLAPSIGASFSNQNVYDKQLQRYDPNGRINEDSFEVTFNLNVIPAYTIHEIRYAVEQVKISTQQSGYLDNNRFEYPACVSSILAILAFERYVSEETVDRGGDNEERAYAKAVRQSRRQESGVDRISQYDWFVDNNVNSMKEKFVGKKREALGMLRRVGYIRFCDLGVRNAYSKVHPELGDYAEARQAFEKSIKFLFDGNAADQSSNVRAIYRGIQAMEEVVSPITDEFERDFAAYLEKEPDVAYAFMVCFDADIKYATFGKCNTDKSEVRDLWKQNDKTHNVVESRGFRFTPLLQSLEDIVSRDPSESNRVIVEQVRENLKTASRALSVVGPRAVSRISNRLVETGDRGGATINPEMFEKNVTPEDLEIVSNSLHILQGMSPEIDHAIQTLREIYRVENYQPEYDKIGQQIRSVERLIAHALTIEPSTNYTNPETAPTNEFSATYTTTKTSTPTSTSIPTTPTISTTSTIPTTPTTPKTPPTTPLTTPATPQNTPMKKTEEPVTPKKAKAAKIINQHKSTAPVEDESKDTSMGDLTNKIINPNSATGSKTDQSLTGCHLGGERTGNENIKATVNIFAQSGEVNNKKTKKNTQTKIGTKQGDANEDSVDFGKGGRYLLEHTRYAAYFNIILGSVRDSQKISSFVANKCMNEEELSLLKGAGENVLQSAAAEFTFDTEDAQERCVNYAIDTLSKMENHGLSGTDLVNRLRVPENLLWRTEREIFNALMTLSGSENISKGTLKLLYAYAKDITARICSIGRIPRSIRSLPSVTNCLISRLETAENICNSHLRALDFYKWRDIRESEIRTQNLQIMIDVDSFMVTCQHISNVLSPLRLISRGQSSHLLDIYESILFAHASPFVGDKELANIIKLRLSQDENYSSLIREDAKKDEKEMEEDEDQDDYPTIEQLKTRFFGALVSAGYLSILADSCRVMTSETERIAAGAINIENKPDDTLKRERQRTLSKTRKYFEEVIDKIITESELEELVAADLRDICDNSKSELTALSLNYEARFPVVVETTISAIQSALDESEVEVLLGKLVEITLASREGGTTRTDRKKILHDLIEEVNNNLELISVKLNEESAKVLETISQDTEKAYIDGDLLDADTQTNKGEEKEEKYNKDAEDTTTSTIQQDLISSKILDKKKQTSSYELARDISLDVDIEFTKRYDQIIYEILLRMGDPFEDLPEWKRTFDITESSELLIPQEEDGLWRVTVDSMRYALVRSMLVRDSSLSKQIEKDRVVNKFSFASKIIWVISQTLAVGGIDLADLPLYLTLLHENVVYELYGGVNDSTYTGCGSPSKKWDQKVYERASSKEGIKTLLLFKNKPQLLWSTRSTHKGLSAKELKECASGTMYLCIPRSTLGTSHLLHPKGNDDNSNYKRCKFMKGKIHKHVNEHTQIWIRNMFNRYSDIYAQIVDWLNQHQQRKLTNSVIPPDSTLMNESIAIVKSFSEHSFWRRELMEYLLELSALFHLLENANSVSLVLDKSDRTYEIFVQIITFLQKLSTSLRREPI